MMENVNLTKEVYGMNTYTKAVNTRFTELINPVTVTTEPDLTITRFFEYYDQLFFQIPVSGETNSHTYLVERSQTYIGGSVLDAEKQALIEEINALRQQILEMNQGFNNINNIIQ